MPSTTFSSVPPANGTRADLVPRAVSGWVELLTDFSAKNNLLYYRDLRLRTLDLAETADTPRQRLLDRRTVRCSQLFPDRTRDADAVNRLRTIYRTIRKLDEEYGISTGYVAVGMASWSDDRRSPAAPVVLNRLSLVPTSVARDDFQLTLDEEFVINPVLLRKLQSSFHLDISAQELASLVEENPFDPTPAYKQLRQLAVDIPEFSVTHRLIAGTFSYAKLPMVEDLQTAGDLLAGNDIVAALAGDERALRLRETQWHGTVDLSRRQVSPTSEFLVLDADKSQAAAINAVVTGRNLVIQGPPGTGKSQTIANIIAALSAAGKRVLFVADNRIYLHKSPSTLAIDGGRPRPGPRVTSQRKSHQRTPRAMRQEPKSQEWGRTA